MKRTESPRGVIQNGPNGPERVPYTGDDMPPWLQDFLACLGLVGFVSLVFLLALWLGER